ncbi:MAG: helix-turn-helix domain-containing protein [Flexilinea sp.]
MKSIDDALIQSMGEMLAYVKGDTTKARSKRIRIDPIPVFSAEEIKSIREKTKLTQSSFAFMIGVSKKTIETWEAGTSHPAGAARRLLSMIKNDPQYADKFIFIHEPM